MRYIRSRNESIRTCIFVQQTSKILYGCLVDVRLQPDASRLLHKLHTLVKPLAVCEMIVLEEFSKYQVS